MRRGHGSRFERIKDGIRGWVVRIFRIWSIFGLESHWRSILRVVAKDSNHRRWDEFPESPDEEPDRRSITFSRTTDKKPLTDIEFVERRVGEEGISPDQDDVEITTDWQPRLTSEERRFEIFELHADLRGCPRSIRKAVDRLRRRGEKRLNITEELRRDRRSLAGRKLQTAIRAKIASAFMRGVPDGAALWLTIDIAAIPSLAVWQKAGGMSARELKDQAIRLFNDALVEVGAVHVLNEGYFEVAKVKNLDLVNPRRAQFVKSYARTQWPASIVLSEEIGSIFVPHFHKIVVLLDAEGNPIDVETFKRALKKRFPALRAIHIRPADGGHDAAGGKLLPASVEKAMRYAAKRTTSFDDDEIAEQQRWYDALEPEDLWTSGWTSSANVRPMSVPIMRRSLLGWQKLRDALVQFEIGCGWSGPKIVKPVQQAQRPASNVIRLSDHRRMDRVAQPSMIFIPVNNNAPPVGARAGPHRRAA